MVAQCAAGFAVFLALVFVSMIVIGLFADDYPDIQDTLSYLLNKNKEQK